MSRKVIVAITLAVASTSVANAQTPAPLPAPGSSPPPVEAVPSPVDGQATGQRTFGSSFDPTFGPTFDQTFGNLTDSGFSSVGSDGISLATRMRERVERATNISLQTPNASSMFGGQFSTQNAAVEQDRRSRLIDELSLILRSLRPVAGGPGPGSAGGSVSSGDH